MGVALIIWGRFPTKNGNVTVPAPNDTPQVTKEWLYDLMASKAQGLRRVGFTAMQGPPCGKCQGGAGPGDDGYGLFDPYDIGDKNQQGSETTRYGSAESLRKLIAVCHANDMRYYHDIVLHQRMGGNNGVYNFVGADGKTLNGRWPLTPGCFRGYTFESGGKSYTIAEDSVPNTYWDISFGDELSYQHSFVPRYNIDSAVTWGKWLFATTGADGMRLDDVKGLWAPFVAEFRASMSSIGVVYGEFFDNANNALGWANASPVNGTIMVEDFQGKFSTENACNSDSAYPLNDGGVWSMEPTMAITFAQNPDTDLSAGQETTQALLLAYAEMLTNPGYPFVAGKDYFGSDVWPGAYGLHTWIDTLVGVHENLMFGDPRVIYMDNDIKVKMSDGYPGLLTGLNFNTYNNRTLKVPTTFGANVELHDYSGHRPNIWTDSQGNATIEIPCNAYNGGQGYVLYSRTGYWAAPNPPQRSTTQTFECSDDLAIPATVDGLQEIGAVYIEAGTPVIISFATDASGWVNGTTALSAVVTGPTGEILIQMEMESAAKDTAHATAKETGRHVLNTATAGLSGSSASTFTITYTAPRTA